MKIIPKHYITTSNTGVTEMSIKISDINKHNNSGRLIYKDVIKPEKYTSDNFATRFKQMKGKSVTEKLNFLLADIDEQSQKLGNKLYLSDLVKYKKLVKEFLDFAVRNTYQFSKESFLDRKGRHRVFSMVQEVDKELEKLTKQFLSDEKDSIKILKKMDDIRGMLIDIFM